MNKQIKLLIDLLSSYEDIVNTTDFIYYDKRDKIAVSKNGKIYIMRNKYNELMDRIKKEYGIEFINLKIKKCGYYIIE